MKINWTLIICLVILIAFWVFAVWVLGNIVILREKVNLYNTNNHFLDILRQRKKQFKISMFRESYHCPKGAKEKHCKTIARIAEEHGVDKQIMIDLSWEESGIRDVLGREDPRDRGWFQINSYWHSEVSNKCAHDLECSAYFTAEMIKQGRGYEWVAWEKVIGN